MAKQQGALFKKMIEQNRLRISLKELSIASGGFRPPAALLGAKGLH